MPTIIGGGAGETGGVATIKELLRNSNVKTVSLAAGSYTVPAGKVFFLTFLQGSHNGAAKNIHATLGLIVSYLANLPNTAGSVFIGCDTPLIPDGSIFVNGGSTPNILYPVTSADASAGGNKNANYGSFVSDSDSEWKYVPGHYIAAFEAGTVLAADAGTSVARIQGYEVDASLVSGQGSAGAATYQELITVSGNWIVPDGVTEIEVDVIGAGGGGSGGCDGGDGNQQDGAGGGGGMILYAIPLVVTPGQSIAAVIGAGGTGGAGRSDGSINGGTAGGATKFGNLTAFGGKPGDSNSDGGSGGGNVINGGGSAGAPVGFPNNGADMLGTPNVTLVGPAIFHGAGGGAGSNTSQSPGDGGYGLMAPGGDRSAGNSAGAGAGGYGLAPGTNGAGGTPGVYGLTTGTDGSTGGVGAGGGGGGGSDGTGGNGGNGGPGLVVIRYRA